MYAWYCFSLVVCFVEGFRATFSSFFGLVCVFQVAVLSLLLELRKVVTSGGAQEGGER